MTSRLQTSVILALILVLSGTTAEAGIELKSSEFDESALRLKYQFSSEVSTDLGYLEAVAASTDSESFDEAGYKRKSPLKAFLLSIAVPGLGQYYYGSKIKPIAFLGTEVAAWALYFKYNGDGNDAEDAFETFNKAHWSRFAYEQKYLKTAYNGITDDDLIGAKEISHHLPDGETQQYFEMAGKYDQFAWGWDDARYNGQSLQELIDADSLQPISTAELAPVTARRQIYENMRHDANQKFQRARNMVILSIVNRLVSSFDAYISTKRINDRARSSGSFLTSVRVKPSIKSMNEALDTPYVNLSFKF